MAALAADAARGQARCLVGSGKANLSAPGLARADERLVLTTERLATLRGAAGALYPIHGDEKPTMRQTCLALLFLMCMSGTACAPSQTDLQSPSSVVGADLQGQPATLEQVAYAIRAGASGKGWAVISEEPGVTRATVNSGGHEATVRIEYTAAGWVIRHESSSLGIKYEPDYRGREIIHYRYNLWVRNLDRAIQNALRDVRAAPPPPSVPTSGGQQPVDAPAPAPTPAPEPAAGEGAASAPAAPPG